jgi:hypothetical protein
MGVYFSIIIPACSDNRHKSQSSQYDVVAAYSARKSPFLSHDKGGART